MRGLAAALAVAALAVAACVDLRPPPDLVYVRFDPASTPPLVPTPTDLAMDPVTGRMNIPIADTASPAERELLGWLNELDGFPAVTPAVAALNGRLDPATVNARNVRVLDLAAGGAPVLDAVISYHDAPPPGDRDAAAHLRVTLPAGRWALGGRYAIALVGGPDGLRGATGEEVVGEGAWLLLRSLEQLTTCEDLDAADCRAATDIIPSAERDPFRRAEDQAKKAVLLERFRRQIKPLLDDLVAQGIPRDHVAMLWTFRITARPEATFDPEALNVPFPTDLARLPAEGGRPPRVNVPIPDDAPPAERAILEALNRLDGFSTTATAVSERGAATGALDSGALDAASLAAGAGFLAVTPGVAAPEVEICLGCDVAVPAEDVAPAAPQQIQFVPRAPLASAATYGGYLTTDLRDVEGRPVIASPAFALLRSPHPLVDDAGRAVVSVVTDEQARLLESARRSLAPFLDLLEARGIPRRRLALAFAFTTQTTDAALQALGTLPARMGDALPATVSPLNDDLTQVLTGLKPVNQNPFPSDQLGAVIVSRVQLPDALTGPGRTLDVQRPRAVEVPFVLTLPRAAPPAGGYPVVVFGHAFTSYRLSMLGLANALAARGVALLAIDLPRHGDRATCVGARHAVTLQAEHDDQACADPSTQRCDADPASPTYGRCVARRPQDRASCTLDLVIARFTGDAGCFVRGQGLCLADGHCEGGAWRQDADRQPLVSGWDFIHPDFFSVRDTALQWAADVAQLVRVIEADGPGSLRAQLGDARLDPGKVHYVGMSLGASLGALAAAAVPALRGVVLNAPGADLPTILLQGLTPEAREAFIAEVRKHGREPGTPEFDELLNVLRWILDPSDAANQIARAADGAERRVLLQYIEGDPIFPNASTERIVRAAARAGTPPTIDRAAGYPMVSGRDRHGYLVTGLQDGKLPDHRHLTTETQTNVVEFLFGKEP